MLGFLHDVAVLVQMLRVFIPLSQYVYIVNKSMIGPDSTLQDLGLRYDLYRLGWHTASRLAGRQSCEGGETVRDRSTDITLPALSSYL
jgi:hypothetical protein